jgi:deoxyribonuclease-1
MILLLLPTFAIAQQSVISGYDSARDQYFWDKLYVFGGTSLYCNIEFGEQGVVDGMTGKNAKMTLEHVYPADWMATHFECENRNTCENKTYKHAEADLHNLWAANGRVNSSRGDKKFAELVGETSRRFTEFCEDYERRGKKGEMEAVVEPQDAVKGNIARSLLYMKDSYGFDLLGMDEMILKWHEEDPVSHHEIWRNEAIFHIQGTRNNWISG